MNTEQRLPRLPVPLWITSARRGSGCVYVCEPCLPGHQAEVCKRWPAWCTRKRCRWFGCIATAIRWTNYPTTPPEVCSRCGATLGDET